MRTGFLWGILSGAIAAAAMVWVVPAFVAPNAPAPSALTGETERSEAAPGLQTAERPRAAAPADDTEFDTTPPAVDAAPQPDRLAAVAPAAPSPAGETAEASGESTAATDRAPAATPKPEAEAEPPADPRAPAFDVVRVDPTGQTVLAGTAAPGETVEVLLDGEVVDKVEVDDSGKFVAVLTAEPTGGAHELQLRVAVSEAGLDPAPAPAPNAPALPNAAADAASTPPSGNLRRPQPDLAGSGESVEPSAAAIPGASTSPLVAGSGPPPPGPAAGSAGVVASSNPGIGRLAMRDQATAGAEGGPAESPSAAKPPPGERYLFSAPVIILPSEQVDDAPAVVEAGRDELAMLQPQGGPVEGVVLDQLTYDPQGRVVLSGRAQPGHAVRIYGNGGLLGTAPTADGAWELAVAENRARDLQLLRFDEIDRSGRVTSRIEAPFEYSVGSPQTVQNREIVIERGDNLWRIAEQFYGEGIRYSVIFGANRDLIRDPDLIYPDQVFTIPELVEAE